MDETQRKATGEAVYSGAQPVVVGKSQRRELGVAGHTASLFKSRTPPMSALTQGNLFVQSRTPAHGRAPLTFPA